MATQRTVGVTHDEHDGVNQKLARNLRTAHDPGRENGTNARLALVCCHTPRDGRLRCVCGSRQPGGHPRPSPADRRRPSKMSSLDRRAFQGTGPVTTRHGRVSVGGLGVISRRRRAAVLAQRSPLSPHGLRLTPPTRPAGVITCSHRQRPPANWRDPSRCLRSARTAHWPHGGTRSCQCRKSGPRQALRG